MGCSCFGALLFQKRHATHSEQPLDGFSSERNIGLFSFTELKSATDNFHSSNRIGRGGFGTVYKGTLKNGIIVAVKVLSAESRQGIKEFLTEIDVITNVKHPNLVELIGCCVEGNNRILIYDYLANGSLDHALLSNRHMFAILMIIFSTVGFQGTKSDATKLNWYIRSEICLGVAKGLTYLHEALIPPVIHRDIKPSNILLDRNFVPKIGDFGVAKLFPDNITHISTRVAGTTGYLAPEYAMKGQLTKKADTYSFGVLVLEIVCGRSNSRSFWEIGKPLLEWVWELFEGKRPTEIVDPALKEYPEEQVLRYIKVGLFCTQAAAGRRPSMSQVVEMLSKPVQVNDQEITEPGYMEESGRFNKGFRTKKLVKRFNENRYDHPFHLKPCYFYRNDSQMSFAKAAILACQFFCTKQDCIVQASNSCVDNAFYSYYYYYQDVYTFYFVMYLMQVYTEAVLRAFLKLILEQLAKNFKTCMLVMNWCDDMLKTVQLLVLY